MRTMSTDIINKRWRALAGPPEYAQVVVEGHERVEIVRVYRGNDTTRAEAIAMQIVSDHNQILGIVEAARRMT